jgi:4'-phosphopantetheinyl transferase
VNVETSMEPDDVHIWMAFPDSIPDPALLAAYRELMTADERERQQRFRLERHRHQFLVARALVRTMLSRLGGAAPDRWRFSTNRHGRPEIVSPGGLPPLRFNLSHTEGIVVCAVAFERDIGVDVEDAHRKRIAMELADRYFSREEACGLHALPSSRQRDRFLEYWTLKEAYIKAKGMGLAIPLERFSFHMEEGLPLRVSFDASLHDQPDAWYFCLMQLTARHKGALALRQRAGEPVGLHFREVIPLAEDHAVDIEVLHTSREIREPS